MASVNIKFVCLLLIFLIAGCGLENNPSGGHDPNKPLPIIISDSAAVLVNHATGAIVTTPDGMATLSVSQTALSADTSFEIKPYFLNPPGGPIFAVGQMYNFSPKVVPTLNPGAILEVTLHYDSSQFPIYDQRVNSPTNPYVQEVDLRLGVFQDNSDYTFRCWSGISFQSPPVITGPSPHRITNGTSLLGLFGITSTYSYICPYNFLYPPH